MPEALAAYARALPLDEVRSPPPLELPAGVELLADSELAVIHVIAPRVVEEETEGEGEEGEVVEAAAAAEGAEAAPEDDAAEKASK